MRTFTQLGMWTIMHHWWIEIDGGLQRKPASVWSFVILIDDKWHIFWEKWLNIHQKGERKSIFIKFQTIHYSTKIKRRLVLSKYFQTKILEQISRHIHFDTNITLYYHIKLESFLEMNRSWIIFSDCKSHIVNIAICQSSNFVCLTDRYYYYHLLVDWCWYFLKA